MLGACLPDEIETAVRDEVMPTISSPEEARAFAAAAEKFRKTVAVQVKVDTGMGRLGVAAERAVDLIREIQAESALKLEEFTLTFRRRRTTRNSRGDRSRGFKNLSRNWR